MRGREAARAIALVLAALGAAILSAACGNAPPERGAIVGPEAASAASWTPGAFRLEPSEVTEYRGQALTPRSSLPDNSIAGPQGFDLGSYRLRVSGLVKTPLSLGYEQVLALPAAEKLVTLHCVEGWSATMLWTGTTLAGLLDLAGADPVADTLVFVCLDGYETTMELRWARERSVILAWASNGVPLDGTNGAPFQVVAEDKWGYKWAKWVCEIRVLREPGYRGFWESRGYAVGGNLGERFSEPVRESVPSGLR